MQSSRLSLLVLPIALTVACCPGFLAGQTGPPKIIIAAKKPTPFLIGKAAINFGVSCRATSGAKSPYYSSYKASSVAEMMGAPVKAIIVTRYGTGWKSRDDIRATLQLVLTAQTDGAMPYEPWDEGVFPDLAGEVRFTDKTERAFEESGGHVCFVDHNGAAIWTRVRLPETP